MCRYRNTMSAALLLSALLGYAAFTGVTRAATDAMSEEEGLTKDTLRHVVLFRFKPETTQEEIDLVIKTLRKLPEAIPEVRAFEWGVENSGRGLNDDYTHCALFTYDSKADLQIYLEHPVHVAAGELVGQYVESTFIFDYWAQD